MFHDTIVALSSGQGRAALAIVRLSGPRVRFVIETVLRSKLEPWVAQLVTLRAGGGSVIDRCIGLYFAAPKSSTGEDVLELHLHGSLAVVRATLDVLTSIDGIRLAEPGEFTRRSLENGKLDLLQVEALGDLLSAETVEQLRQAQRQLSGELGALALGWRDTLVGMRALLEAELDFADEGDVGSDLSESVRRSISGLIIEASEVLGQADQGRRIRDGAIVVIVGAPNSGKSTLINALARRPVAIVSDQAGTTRDILEAPIDLGGWPVILVDTAGLRESTDEIEREGVRRARAYVERADVVLSVFSADIGAVSFAVESGTPILRVGSKSDIAVPQHADYVVSALVGEGMEDLRAAIASLLNQNSNAEPALVARERQREVLQRFVWSLQRANEIHVPELMAEELRHASFALGSLVGQTDLDTVLDSLFRGFCIGK